MVTRKKSRSGQAILLTVVAIGLVMAGGLGFAIDSAQLYFHRQMAQAAADAAATAAILTIFQGTNTGAGSFSTSGAFSCGTNVTMIPCKYANAHGFGGSNTDDTINVSFPGSAPGYSSLLSGSDSPNQVTVQVQRNVHNTFIKLLGAAATSTISAQATAAILATQSPTPILVTDPSDPDTLSSNGSTGIIICGGPSRSIQINSNASQAFSAASVDLSHAGPNSNGTCKDAPTGGDFGVFGGPTTNPGSITLGPDGHYIQPASPTQDPFASINPPAVPGNAPAPQSITNKDGCTGTCTEFSPGAYPSGLNATGLGKVVFRPGIYYMESSGFTLKQVTAIMCSGCAPDGSTGNGMLVYDTGPGGVHGDASGGFKIDTLTTATLVGANVTVTTPPATPVAPTGPYFGILFFEDRNAVTQTHQLGQGNSCFNFFGWIYITNSAANMPAEIQTVNMNGGTCSGTLNQGGIIAGKIGIVGHSTISMELFPSSLLKTRQVALVQ